VPLVLQLLVRLEVFPGPDQLQASVERHVTSIADQLVLMSDG
jgi:hypothetical protein